MKPTRVEMVAIYTTRDSGLDRTTIAVMIVVTIDPVVEVVRTVIIGKTATGRSAPLTVVTGRDLLPAGPNTMIVAHPGLRLRGESMMIEGLLQGTMITDGGLMMIAEPLIIMTDAGTKLLLTDAETTEDATRRMTGTKTGPRGTQTEMAVGATVNVESDRWFSADVGATEKKGNGKPGVLRNWLWRLSTLSLIVPIRIWLCGPMYLSDR